MSAAHTPTPWPNEWLPDGPRDRIYCVIDLDEIPTDAPRGTPHKVWESISATGANRIANAAFIVRACNAHDELVAALTLIANQPREGDIPQQVVRMQRIARAALAKAQA